MWIDTKAYSSRLASAVTLSSGDVFLTGGKTQERNAFLVSWDMQGGWTMKQLWRMKHGRIGHGGVTVVVNQEEQVVVAGGWDAVGQIQDSVEMFSMKTKAWRMLQPLPTPRTDFILQVTYLKVL